MRNPKPLANKVLFGSTLAIMGLVFGIIATTPALAAKGGQGKNSSGPVISVGEFGSAAAGESFEITGSGFKADSTVYVGIKYYCCMVPVVVDGFGSFSLAHTGLNAGNYTAVAMVYAKHKWLIGAQGTFTVE